VKIAAGGVDQPGLRFAAVTLDLQLADFAQKAFVRMVWAHVDPIHVRTTFAEQGFKASVNLLKTCPRDITTRDHRLIGCNNRQHAGLIDPPYGFSGSVMQQQLLRAAQMIDLKVQRSVAIQEDR
jgi:hypothetical protein